MMDNFTAQGAFSSLLRAMARPGTVYPMPGNAMMSALHALLDNEVTCHVSGDDRLSEELRQETGCVVADLADADFIVVPQGNSMGSLRGAKRGTLDYPDRGATVLFGVRAFGKGESLRLTGPGIEGEAVVSVEGWCMDDARSLEELNSEFPLGVDCILVGESGVLCIPRSSRLEVL